VRGLADVALFALLVALFVAIGAFLGAAQREHREAREWEEFSQQHCRISGSYDKEAERATPVVAKHPLKVYHCDDGSIHVR